MQKTVRIFDFIGSLDFGRVIEILLSERTDHILIFDISCDKISRSKQFGKIAKAARHRKLICIFLKHKILHKGANGRDTVLQSTHIVLFKSPRDVQQIDVVGKHLGLGNTLRK